MIFSASSSVASRSNAINSKQESMSRLIERAAVLYGNTESAPAYPNPDEDNSHTDRYTLRRALLDAGADESDAESRHLRSVLANLVTERRDGRVPPPAGKNNEAEKEERFEKKLKIFQYVSMHVPHRELPKQGAMMRQAGFSGKDLKPGAVYMRCKRRRDEAVTNIEQQAKQAMESSLPFDLIDAEVRRDFVRSTIADDDHRRVSRPAPITTVSPASITTVRRPRRSSSCDDLLSPSSLHTDDSFWISRDDASLMRGSSPREFHADRSMAFAKSLLTDDASKITYKTSSKKQQERKETQRSRVKKSFVFKFASAWYEAVQKNEIKTLTQPEKIADFFNDAFLLKNGEGISANEISRAYQNGTCDQRLPLSSPNSRLDDDVYQLLCDAMWTMTALEQHNGSAERLTVADEKKLLDDIVNDKIAEDNEGLPIEHHEKRMDVEKLRDQIATSNSLKQDLKKVDERVVRQMQWCTYDNQLKHYKASEKALVEQGYARYPSNDEERVKHGYVVFHPGQNRRFVNIGEVQVTFDRGCEEAGGPSSMTHSVSDIREGGKAAPGSEESCTLLMGIVGDEPMPYLMILPSSAPEGGMEKIHPDLFIGCHQILAKYGYQCKQYHHPSIATSPNGIMTGKIMSNWIMELQALFPDLSDTPGKRVFMKSDTGSGHDDIDFLLRSRLLGIDIFPSLPNGTEVGHEMDQLLSGFKKDLYLNRDKLRLWGGGKISKWDLGLIIHGGVVVDPNNPNRTLELVDAFQRNFTAKKIRAARNKCGYCPATRNGLHDPKIRLVVDGEEIEQASDPRLQLVLDAEKSNHEAVDALVAKGYKSGHKLKRFATGLEDHFEWMTL